MKLLGRLFAPRSHVLTVDIGLLLLRVVFGGLMCVLHGLFKLLNFGDLAPKFMNFMGLGGSTSLALAVFAEFFCAILLVLGLATRAAAIPLVFTMAVAAFIAHGADPLAKKEMALLFLAGFTMILLAGPGRFSLDAVLSRKAKSAGRSGE